MMRIALVIALALGLIDPSFVAEAQTPTKLPRVGWLGNMAPPPPPVGQLEGFRQGLREAGYVEGQNVIIEYRWAEGHLDRLPALALELASLKVDVLMVSGPPALEAAKRAGTIPIVDVTCDPMEIFGVSLARPGASATGLTCVSSELAPKRLQLLRETLPGLARLGILYSLADPSKGIEASQLEAVAQKLGVVSLRSGVGAAGEFESAFTTLSHGRAQGIIVLADAFMNFHRKTITGLAARHHLPAMYGFREYVDDGGLMSYGANLKDQFRRAGGYVAKILKGAKPADLPIEQPTRFEFLINLKTAKALGLTIPPSLLGRADEAIQ